MPIEAISTTTGINNITTDATLENAPAFNLAGQKVGKAYKGVVIKAGKKFVQKKFFYQEHRYSYSAMPPCW